MENTKNTVKNTYKKYCPNVFVAQCEEAHEKGEIITLTSKYGKESEVEIYNLVGKRNEYFYYSFVRCDGLNSQERAKAKADKYESWANSRERKSDQEYQNSQKGKDFLSLGEPIKIGHHSEKRHRKLIESNWDAMGRSVEHTKKAEEHLSKAEYWESQADKIDLSMPESIDYFKSLSEKKEEAHLLMKTKPELRTHSYSLQYANKEKKEALKKYQLALKLWGE